MTFCVGTYTSGCNLIDNEELGGTSTEYIDVSVTCFLVPYTEK